MNPTPCPLCQQTAACKTQNFPLFIHKFEYSYLVLGSHQFYNGYCVLLAKTHARELHQLPIATQQGLANELMQAGQAVYTAFKPWKMNYACYGNQVEHIHWHIFPRYQTDPKHRECPFSNAELFANFPTDSHNSQEKILLLRSLLTVGAQHRK